MANLKVSVEPADHTLGEEHAPVTLVEYGDYECPHCGHAHPIVQAVRKHFGKQLRFVFRNFPLTEIHPHAEMAAEAAEFAGANDRFWEMHDAIFENQTRLGMPLLAQLATRLGLSAGELAASVENHQHLARIKSDFMGGVRSGVNGTPTFFLNGERYEGSWEFEDLVEAIEEELPRKTERRRVG